MSAVESVLALSTTIIAVDKGRVTAFSQRAASPSGSRRASLRAGMTISIAGCFAGSGRVSMAVTGSRGQLPPYEYSEALSGLELIRVLVA
jgi:hypothetical protein